MQLDRKILKIPYVYSGGKRVFCFVTGTQGGDDGILEFESLKESVTMMNILNLGKRGAGGVNKQFSVTICGLN